MDDDTPLKIAQALDRGHGYAKSCRVALATGAILTYMALMYLLMRGHEKPSRRWPGVGCGVLSLCCYIFSWRKSVASERGFSEAVGLLRDVPVVAVVTEQVEGAAPAA